MTEVHKKNNKFVLVEPTKKHHLDILEEDMKIIDQYAQVALQAFLKTQGTLASAERLETKSRMINECLSIGEEMFFARDNLKEKLRQERYEVNSAIALENMKKHHEKLDIED